MKTTLEIPDELYRKAKVRAAQDSRKIKDLVSEGLRLVLGIPAQTSSRRLRMVKAPITVRRGNVLPALSNDTMAELLTQSGEQLP